MAHPPRGIQLARTTPTGLLRATEAVLVAALFVAAWGAASFGRTRTEIAAESGPASPTGGATSTLAASPDAAGAIAALLEAGVVRGPRLSHALDRALAAAPPGFRITSIEVRPLGRPGVVEAAVAAEVTSEPAVAAFLAALSREAAVPGSGVITETRRPERATVVRITFSLATAEPAP